jgi:hypothetical protein
MLATARCHVVVAEALTATGNHHLTHKSRPMGLAPHAASLPTPTGHRTLRSLADWQSDIPRNALDPTGR